MNKATTEEFVISLRTETTWTPQFEVLGCLLLAGEAVFRLPLQFGIPRTASRSRKGHFMVVKNPRLHTG